MGRNYSDDNDNTMAFPNQFNSKKVLALKFSRINKPAVRFETSLSINMHQIKDIFQRVCKKRFAVFFSGFNQGRGFSIIDDEREQITAMCKQFISLKDLCLNCFRGKLKNLNSITTVRLTSKTNKVTCRRKIVLKGLIGV